MSERNMVFSLLTAGFLVCLPGCAQEMEDQPRVDALEATTAYANGQASRRLPEHAIPAASSALMAISRDSVTHPLPGASPLREDTEGYVTGKVNGSLVDSVPSPVLERFDFRALLEQGRVRFKVSCVPCHGISGSGDGMVARRGFKYPPSYHTDRLRQQPLGYLFRVATHGHGKMQGYGETISTDHRWAIAAYVRALQLSQFADVDLLSASDLDALEKIETTTGTEAALEGRAEQ